MTRTNREVYQAKKPGCQDLRSLKTKITAAAAPHPSGSFVEGGASMIVKPWRVTDRDEAHMMNLRFRKTVKILSSDQLQATIRAHSKICRAACSGAKALQPHEFRQASLSKHAHRIGSSPAQPGGSQCFGWHRLIVRFRIFVNRRLFPPCLSSELGAA